MKPAALLVAFGLAILGAPAAAAELAMLSGGAVEPGLRPVLAAFTAATGHTVRLVFNPAPQIAQRVEAGEVWDVVLAPVALLERLATPGRLGGERVAVGAVGIGVAVRADAPVPEIGDVESLRRSLLAADSVVFNRASTGVAFEGVLRRLDIAPQIEPKTTRYVDGAGVMEHLLQGRRREVGFAAITEILLFRDRGVRYVGPLPAALQNHTSYAAVRMQLGAEPDAARQLLLHLGSPAARAQFEAAGIDPAR